MASLSADDIRTRVATKLTTFGMKESIHAHPLFPVLDSMQAVHWSFSVGVQNTRHYGSVRQRSGIPIPSETDLEVRWAYRLRSDAQVQDYNTALGLEVDILNEVLATSELSLDIQWVSSQRTVDADGKLFIGTLTLRALHNFDPFS